MASSRTDKAGLASVSLSQKSAADIVCLCSVITGGLLFQMHSKRV